MADLPLERKLRLIISQIFLGIHDAVSIQRTLPTIYQSPAIAKLIVSILVMDLTLLVGSVYAYATIFRPSLSLILERSVYISNDLVYIIFHAYWILPIFLLCYVVSTIWYQQISSEYVKIVKIIPKGKPSSSASFSWSVYSFSAWLVFYLQTQLLCNAFLLARPFKLAVSWVFGDSSVFFVIANITLSILCCFATLCGFTGSCVLFAWYAFDNRWIASGLDPDTRFALIEDEWAYYVGWGIPSFILVKANNFFVGFGLYLSLFPFCILLGFLSDAYKKKQRKRRHHPSSLRMFWTTKFITRKIFMFIDSFLSPESKTLRHLIPNNQSFGKSRRKTD